MAGLLDFLTTDDAQLGLGLMAASGPSTTPMSLGQRIAVGVQQAQASKDGRLRNKLLESQIAENASQDALRQQQLMMAKRKLDMQQGLLGYGGGAGMGAPGGAAPAMGAAPGAGGAPAGGMQPQGGASGAMPPPQTPVGTPRGPMTLAQISQQYKIPYESLAFDLVNNDGKGIAEMVFKRGTPDMQVSNGFAYDKNQLGAGYLPQLNISSNGQATQVQIGPDGQPVVSAPRGAVGTYGAYQSASNRSAADYQPERVLAPDGQMVVRPRSEVLQPSAPPVLPGRPLGAAPAGTPSAFGALPPAQQGVTGNYAGDPSAIVAGIANIRDPQERANAMAAFEQQMRQTPTQAPLIGPGAGGAPVVTAGNVVELSPAQQAQNEANRAAMVDRAKAGVVRETASAATGRQMSQMQEAARLANTLLDEGPTGSGVGALVDRVGNFVGQPIKGASQAAQLKALGGWLVANVPRMEGPQSDRDVANYNTMAGQVGDETLPPATRKAALQTVIALQNKYAAINGGAAPDGRTNPAPGTLPSGWTVKVK
jgi:hypothetical protein